MTIHYQNKQRKHDIETLKKTINLSVSLALDETAFGKYLRKNEIDPVISVVFVGCGTIRKLNNEYRGIDKVTDVLSFPQQNCNGIARKPIKENIYNDDSGKQSAILGDIVICIERAAEQSKTIGQSLEVEIQFLVIHSLLHLIGYDHVNIKDEEQMTSKQRQILKIIGNKNL